MPGRELGLEASTDLDVGCVLVATALGLILGSMATGLPLTFEAAPAVALFAASSGCDGAWSDGFSCDEVVSATVAASVGSVVSMVTSSGFITSS